MAQTTISPPKTGGDDLDDGLELDPDLLADSDLEEEDGEQEDEVSGDEDVVEEEAVLDQEDAEEDEEAEAEAEAGGEGSKKRKAEVAAEPEAEADEKKRRKKEKVKERKARVGRQLEPVDVRRELMAEGQKQEANATIPSNVPITHLSTTDLSTALLKSIRESYRNATAMELEDVVIPDDRLLPPPTYKPIVAEPTSFEPLIKRIETLLLATQKAKLPNATPRIIILSLSGLRCADVVRGVRGVKGEGEVAKLFAKHFKLADQVKYLEKTKVSIAVGTPARVGKLLAENAIKITKNTVVLLDIGHSDSKTRSLLTLPEVRDELWKSVFSGAARETLLGGGAKISVF
ncbi:protein CMS1, partial [Tremellales sp. Uapishka_1]